MVILAHGCFDLLHIGHVKLLQSAKSLGNKLIVTITADQYISKGLGRPLFNELERLEMIQALKCVDHAEILYEPTAVTGILKYKPDIYIKGQDYARKHDANLELERQAVESYGGRLIILKIQPVYSSTEVMTGKLLRDKIQANQYELARHNPLADTARVLHLPAKQANLHKV